MIEYSVFTPRLLPQKEYFSWGHRACQGCGEVLVLRYALKILGKNVIVVSATGCMEIVSSPYPETAWKIPWIHVAFENTAAVASGIESALKILKKKGKYNKDTVVLGVGGDGGTSDIGIQALSGALERGHKFIYICTDNEAYMNTGIQRSGSTPYAASTTTSPAGKQSIGQRTWKKDIPKIVAAHNIPYVATACHSYPFDLMNKVAKAKEANGPAYLHILSVCPTGWRTPSDLTIRMGRLAVETGIFPLYEIENGKYKLNIEIPYLRPVSDYLKIQGRFRHLTPELIKEIQEKVNEEYEKIIKLSKMS